MNWDLASAVMDKNILAIIQNAICVFGKNSWVIFLICKFYLSQLHGLVAAAAS